MGTTVERHIIEVDAQTREAIQELGRVADELGKLRAETIRGNRANRRFNRSMARNVQTLRRAWRHTQSLAAAQRRLIAFMVGSEGPMDAFRKVMRLTFGTAIKMRFRMEELGRSTDNLTTTLRRAERAWLTLRVQFSEIFLQAAEGTTQLEDFTSALEQFTVDMRDANTVAGRFVRDVLINIIGFGQGVINTFRGMALAANLFGAALELASDLMAGGLFAIIQGPQMVGLRNAINDLQAVNVQLRQAMRGEIPLPAALAGDPQSAFGILGRTLRENTEQLTLWRAELRGLNDVENRMVQVTTENLRSSFIDSRS